LLEENCRREEGSEDDLDNRKESSEVHRESTRG
jgi:hypothetical protein